MHGLGPNAEHRDIGKGLRTARRGASPPGTLPGSQHRSRAPVHAQRRSSAAIHAFQAGRLMRAAITDKNKLVKHTQNHAVLLGETPAVVPKVRQDPAQHYPQADARHRSCRALAAHMYIVGLKLEPRAAAVVGAPAAARLLQHYTLLLQPGSDRCRSEVAAKDAVDSRCRCSGLPDSTPICPELQMVKPNDCLASAVWRLHPGGCTC